MSMSLQGRKICFTGALEGFTRTELEEMAGEYKFRYDKSVKADTTDLVIGDPTQVNSVKAQAARARGIKIWSGDDFIMMLSQDDADGIPDVMSPKKAQAARKASEPERQAYYDKDPEVGMF